MKLFPLFVDLRSRPVLVVGGGAVAERKVIALLAAGAIVRVGASTFTPALRQLVLRGRINQMAGRFRPTWLDGVWLAVTATSDKALNREIAAAANTRHVFVNVADDTELSSFHTPAVVDRAPLMVAISSGGTAPMLARRVRERMETELDQSLGALAALGAHYRGRIRTHYPNLPSRRKFYDWLYDGPVHALVRSGCTQQAARLLDETLTAPDKAAPVGSVVLVGAGPGDPGLLTLHALRALNEADVILHDRLVGERVLALARRDAERVRVGKRPGDNPETAQAHIHALMLEHARAGRHVVRLKGGDPFVFGRGGEELEFLRAHGIRYAVVPGVTAALGCAAYSGIPLTHRRLAHSIRLLTAHSNEALDRLDWTALTQEHQTLAIYMGTGLLARLQEQLIAHGRNPATPFALIENGTRPNQRVLTGKLADLHQVAGQHTVHSPTLLIVGEVASLASRLAWFDGSTESDSWAAAA